MPLNPLRKEHKKIYMVSANKKLDWMASFDPIKTFKKIYTLNSKEPICIGINSCLRTNDLLGSGAFYSQYKNSGFINKMRFV